MLPRRPDTFASKVMTWLEQQLVTPYDLDAIAAVFHVSSRTRLRRFRRIVGQSPAEYRRRFRAALTQK